LTARPEPAKPAPSPAAAGTPPAPPPRRPIFATTGTLAIAPGERATFVAGETENALILTGGVALQYADHSGAQTLDLTAQRVVVFLTGSGLDQVGSIGIDQVEGIYLEGDVIASDGQYTLRGQRVFYDVKRNKAVVLDAVFWTYDRLRRLPLYARAEAIRQVSQDEFHATQARLSASAFFRPGFSIGAREVTIRRDASAPPPAPAITALPPTSDTADPARPEPSRLSVEAKGVTLRAGDVPFAWLPSYSGSPETFPLRDVSLSNSNATGPGIKTQWDLFHLLGIKKRGDVRTDLLADWYLDRGPALGTELEWDRPSAAGGLFAYSVIDDRGTDLFKPGTKLDRGGTTRGMVLGEHRHKIDERWSAYFEASYLGDPAFVDAFLERLGETRREFATQAMVTRRHENELVWFRAKGDLNDFVANEHLLQSQGYSITRLPEIGYVLHAQDLLPGLAPGAVQSWTDARLGRLGMNFDKPAARERGFTFPSLSRRAFGIDPDETIAQRLRREGLFEADVSRFDVRQEFTAPFALGPVRFTPFVVGRFTAYDDDFAEFSPDEDDNNRVWAGAGVRAATTLQRVDDSVSSRLLDLRRIRHVVEPSVTVWHAGSTVDRVDLPVYDEEVESIAEGSAVRVGLDQTWQTQRGGAGRWSTVDVLRLDAAVVLFSGDADRDSPIGRWTPARPEQSQPGEYVTADLVWQTTDAVAVASSAVFDLELNQQARTSAGALVQHAPTFSSFAEGRFINSQDSTYLDAGVQYAMSRRYNLLLVGSYDLKNDDLHSVTAEVRRFSAGILVAVSVGYNTITSETTLGLTLRPLGTGGDAGLRFPGFGAQPGRTPSDLRGTGAPW
ncbi:MAG: LPS-assembly protein LptD, partial [Phycisphaerae bacterium]|nr:LPS-assembly protein LptD [Phycisphaerae bacterium]